MEMSSAELSCLLNTMRFKSRGVNLATERNATTGVRREMLITDGIREPLVLEVVSSVSLDGSVEATPPLRPISDRNHKLYN